MSRRYHHAERKQHFIRAWRHARGLTAQELADAVGISKSTVSRIERGLQPYTQDTLEALAVALDCSAIQLTTRSRLRVPAPSRSAGMPS